MTEVRSKLDWGAFAPLRLKARSVADGVYAGSHKSPRKGSGVEFGGHRAYVPGDDLRSLVMGPADDLAEALFGLLQLPFGLFELLYGHMPSFWLVFWTEL